MAADALSRSPLPNEPTQLYERHAHTHIRNNTHNTVCTLDAGAQSPRPPGGEGSEPRSTLEQAIEMTDVELPGGCEGQTSDGTPGPPDRSVQVCAPEKVGDGLAEEQAADPQFGHLISYLERGCLPKEQKESREVLRESEVFTMLDEVLYRTMSDGTLQLCL